MLIEWYDFICFGIVGFSIFGAIYLLCYKNRYQMFDHDEHNFIGTTTPAMLYESLLPLHPSSSCWRGIHPAWLLATRFVSFIVLCIFLTWDVLLYDYSIFVYYTEWTCTLLIVYFAIGIILSAYECLLYYSSNKSAPPEKVTEDINPVPKNSSIIKLQQGQYYHEKEETEVPRGAISFLSYLLQISYQVCAGSVILTDIVFWFIILPFSSNTHLYLDLLMGCMHSLNIICLLLDTSLNNLSFRWAGISYFVLWSCCYVIFQWFIHACDLLIWWPYPFLKLSTPWAPLWYFCLAVFHLPCYGIYWLLVAFKNSIFSALFPQTSPS